MKFSLILATVGRTVEVARLLASFNAQRYRNFELIVVDQNPDDRLVAVLDPYQASFPILHLRSERGLSRARNVGLKHVTGDVIAFPDDDCWYPESLLDDVFKDFTAHPEWDGMTGRSVDEKGEESAFSFGRHDGIIDRFSVWQQAISYTIFLRRRVIDRVGFFDETLGLGSGTQFGSGEETDYAVRAIQAGFRLYYLPRLFVHHPHPEEVIDQRILQRTFSYGCGMGRVLSKHRYPAWFKVRALIRPLGGVFVSLSKLAAPKAALHWQRCMGRVRGLCSGDFKETA
ncbi:MAG: glycosyltransferase family 2 protein [Pseudomonadota bacterium]